MTEPEPNRPDVRVLVQAIRSELEGMVEGKLFAIAHPSNGNGHQHYVIIQTLLEPEIKSKTICEATQYDKLVRCTVYSDNGIVDKIRSIVKESLVSTNLKTRVYIKPPKKYIPA